MSRHVSRVRHHLGPRDESGGDGGVDVAAGHVADGLGHGGHSHAEGEGDADVLGLHQECDNDNGNDEDGLALSGDNFREHKPGARCLSLCPLRSSCHIQPVPGEIRVNIERDEQI